MQPPSSIRTSIIVSPRERFSPIGDSLRSLFGSIPSQTPVIVVEGCSPERVRAELQELQAERPFEWIRLERFITPNEARNLGLSRVSTELVIFTDNDIVYERDWLTHLEANADRTGAVAVAPLICIGPPAATQTHHAGGSFVVVPGNSLPRINETHRAGSMPVAAVNESNAAARAEVIEFHCCLARKSFLDRIGPLDERLITREHMDFSLRAAINDETISFERQAVVTYDARTRFDTDDLRYYLFRWDEELARRSLISFARTWRIEVNATQLLDGWIGRYRIRTLSNCFPEELDRLGSERFKSEFAEPLARRLTAEAMQTRHDAPAPQVPPKPDAERATRFLAAKLAERAPATGQAATEDSEALVENAPNGSDARARASAPAHALEAPRVVAAPRAGGQRRRMLVAGMSAVPEDRATLREALLSIVPQVDRLFLWLEGFQRAPDIVHPKVVIVRSQEFGALHGAGTFFGLLLCHAPSIYFGVGAQRLYPPDYVSQLRRALEENQHPIVLGVEGSILKRPLRSYAEDRIETEAGAERRNALAVDVLASDTVVFDTTELSFDVRSFPRLRSPDLPLALHCTERGLSRFIVPRKAGWLQAAQTKRTIPARTTDEDAEESVLAQQLISSGSREQSAE